MRPSLLLVLVCWLALAFGTPARAQIGPGPYVALRSYLVLPNAYPGSPALRLRLHVPGIPPGVDPPPGGPFPLLVFGHGLGASPTVYGVVLDHFASWGFVVAAPDSFTDGPQASLAEDMLATWLVIQDQLQAGQAPLDGLVRPGPAGVLGHSMGGGAAVQVAAAEDQIRAILPVAPWDVQVQPLGWLPPSSAVAYTTAPLLIVVGEQDSITPVATDARPIYDQAVGQDRLRELCVVAGADHIADPQLWAVSCAAGVAFFQAYLEDEAAGLDVVYGPTAQASTWIALEYEVTAPDCFLTGTAAPGSTLSVHVSGPMGFEAVAVASAQLITGPPPVPGFGLDPGSLLLLGTGTLDPTQVASVALAVPPDLSGFAGVTVYFQGVARPTGGAWLASPVRQVVLPGP